MVKRFLINPLLIVFFSVSYSMHAQPPRMEGYQMLQPDSRLILPDTLREISGITELDSVQFACIQDEAGILFIVDARRNEIVSQYTFGPPGDYEAIARVGSTFYVLRSDG